MQDRWERSPDVLVVDGLDGASVLLHLGTKFYFTMNKTADLVWQELASPRTVDELARRLEASFRVESAEAEQDVRDLLNELAAERLVRLAS